MELALVKQPSGVLVPDGPADEAYVRKLKCGDVLTGTFKKPRNGGHHRKAFALLSIMFDNQDRFANYEDMLVDVKIKLGHYDHYIPEKGGVVWIPRSISYGAMGQESFEPFYEKLVTLAIQDKTYLRGMDADALDNEIHRRLTFG